MKPFVPAVGRRVFAGYSGDGLGGGGGGGGGGRPCTNGDLRFLHVVPQDDGDDDGEEDIADGEEEDAEAEAEGESEEEVGCPAASAGAGPLCLLGQRVPCLHPKSCRLRWRGARC